VKTDVKIKYFFNTSNTDRAGALEQSRQAHYSSYLQCSSCSEPTYTLKPRQAKEPEERDSKCRNRWRTAKLSL